MVLRKFVPNTENDEEKAASTAPMPEPGGERLDLSSTTFIDREKSHTTQPTDGCVLDYLRHTELEKNKLLQRKIPSPVRASCTAGSLPGALAIRGEIQRGLRQALGTG